MTPSASSAVTARLAVQLAPDPTGTAAMPPIVTTGGTIASSAASVTSMMSPVVAKAGLGLLDTIVTVDTIAPSLTTVTLLESVDPDAGHVVSG